MTPPFLWLSHSRLCVFRGWLSMLVDAHPYCFINAGYSICCPFWSTARSPGISFWHEAWFEESKSFHSNEQMRKFARKAFMQRRMIWYQMHAKDGYGGLYTSVFHLCVEQQHGVSVCAITPLSPQISYMLLLKGEF